MRERSRSDCLSVYHDTPSGGRDDQTSAADVSADASIPAEFASPDARLDDKRARPPRRFALCAALPVYEDAPLDSDVEGDQGSAGTVVHGDALPLVIGPEEIDVLDLEEIVMWGLEGADGTFVCGRNPHTRRRIYGTFDSAAHACGFYSRWGLLRLVYA